jgi:hypothetical protein
VTGVAGAGLVVAAVALPGGGVAAPGGEVGYLPAAGGGIEAVELAGGEVRWHRRGADLPLLALEDRLLAGAREAGGRLRVVALDAAGGKRTFTSQPLRFPAPRFRLGEARVAGGALWLEWRSWDEPGAMPPEAPAVHEHRGLARVRLDDGRVEMLPPSESPPWPAGVGEALEHLALWPAPGGTPGPWRYGGRLAAVAEEPAAQGGRRLVLHTWDAERGEDAKEGGDPRRAVLLEPLPPPGYLHFYGPAGPGHLALLRCNPEPLGEKPAGSVCRWLIFAAADGRQVAELAAEPGTETPLVVLGPRLFYSVEGEGEGEGEGRRLVARGLASGRLLWQRPVAGDLAPPIPPAAESPEEQPPGP